MLNLYSIKLFSFQNLYCFNRINFFYFKFFNNFFRSFVAVFFSSKIPKTVGPLPDIIAFSAPKALRLSFIFSMSSYFLAVTLSKTLHKPLAISFVSPFSIAFITAFVSGLFQHFRLYSFCKQTPLKTPKDGLPKQYTF